MLMYILRLTSFYHSSSLLNCVNTLREVSVEAVIDNYSPLIFTVIKNVDHVETMAAGSMV